MNFIILFLKISLQIYTIMMHLLVFHRFCSFYICVVNFILFYDFSWSFSWFWHLLPALPFFFNQIWFTAFLIVWFVHWSIVWLTDWFTYWLIGWLIDWFIYLFVYLLKCLWWSLIASYVACKFIYWHMH